MTKKDIPRINSAMRDFGKRSDWRARKVADRRMVIGSNDPGSGALAGILEGPFQSRPRVNAFRVSSEMFLALLSLVHASLPPRRISVYLRQTAPVITT